MPETVGERLQRLLAMVPFIIQHPGIKVSEVCRRFGIGRPSLSQDLDLIFLCGLPGYSPGDLMEVQVSGGRVWIRMADYFARPLRLTAREALSLYAGAKAAAGSGVADEALERAIKRLADALGPEALSGLSVALEEDPALGAIRRAIAARERLHLVYYAHSKDETTERTVDPWALVASKGRWYLVGWCHRVQDERIFRADRILDVSLTGEPSEVPADLDLARYRDIYVEGPDGRDVLIDLAPEAAAWVGDYYRLKERIPLEDGWVRVRLNTGATAWLEKLLLGLGRRARVVEPSDLRERVREQAGRLLKLYR